MRKSEDVSLPADGEELPAIEDDGAHRDLAVCRAERGSRPIGPIRGGEHAAAIAAAHDKPAVAKRRFIKLAVRESRRQRP